MSFSEPFISLRLPLYTFYMIMVTGFIVLMDIKRARRWKKMSPNSKLILSTIAGLNLVAFIVIWVL